MSLRPDRQNPALLLDEFEIILLRSLFVFSLFFLRVPGDLLLADVGGIADHRVEGRDLHAAVLDFPKALRRHPLRKSEKGRSRPDIEEVAPGDLGIVFFIDEIAGRQVDRRQVRGEVGDVDPEEIGQERAVGPGRVQLPFSRVGADEEGPAAAGRIHDRFPAGRDAEAVDEIDDLDPGVELAVLVPLVRGDQPLEDGADDLVVEPGEIDLVDLVDQRPPVDDGGVGIKRDAVAEGGVILAEDRLVILGDRLGLGEVLLHVEAEGLPRVDMLRNGELLHPVAVALQQRLVEDQLVDQVVAGELGGPFEVVADALRVVVDDPALFLPHPAVDLGAGTGFLIPLRNGLQGQLDRQAQRRFEGLDELFIRGFVTDHRIAMDDPGEFVQKIIQPNPNGMDGHGQIQMAFPVNLRHLPGAVLLPLPGGVGRFGLPEDEFIDVPGEEKTGTGAPGLGAGVADHGGIVGAPPVLVVGKLDLARQDDGAIPIQQGQIVALAGLTAWPFAAGSQKGQLRILSDQLVDPARRFRREFPFVHRKNSVLYPERIK